MVLVNSVNFSVQKIKEFMKPFIYGYYYIQNTNLCEHIATKLTANDLDSFLSSKTEINTLRERYKEYRIDFRSFENKLKFLIEIYPTPLRWDFIEEEFAMALRFEKELGLIIQKYQLNKFKSPELLRFGYDPEVEG